MLRAVSDSPETIGAAQQRLERLAVMPGDTELPQALHAFARAHLAAALTAAARRDAIRHGWQASDALYALVNLPSGWASIFLFDEKKELAFATYEGSAWSSTRHWLDALHATVWSDRGENMGPLIALRTKMRADGEPEAVRTYARGLLAVLDGAPDQDGDRFAHFRRAQRQLAQAGTEWCWLESRLHAWAALENGDSLEFLHRLEAIAATEEASAIDAAIGARLEPSALYVLARKAGFTVFDRPTEPRLRLPPER